jgi:hypothetical protein
MSLLLSASCVKPGFHKWGAASFARFRIPTFFHAQKNLQIMFTIHIIIGNQSTAVSILSTHTARQILDYLRQNRLVPQLQGGIHLQFNGSMLPLDEPVGNYGVVSSSTLHVSALKRVGFGEGGKETMLDTILKAFAKLK